MIIWLNFSEKEIEESEQLSELRVPSSDEKLMNELLAANVTDDVLKGLHDNLHGNCCDDFSLDRLHSINKIL